MMGVYRNVYGMSIHVPLGDIRGGWLREEGNRILVDYYGDGEHTNEFEGFDAEVRKEILADYAEYLVRDASDPNRPDLRRGNVRTENPMDHIWVNPKYKLADE
jgi:hypothetical protein